MLHKFLLGETAKGDSSLLLKADVPPSYLKGNFCTAAVRSLSGYLVMAEQCLNTPADNPPIGVLICKEHNRVLAKFHLDKLGLPMGITDYEIKKILPTPAQLAKCYADAEAQIASSMSAAATQPTVKRSPKKVGAK